MVRHLYEYILGRTPGLLCAHWFAACRRHAATMARNVVAFQQAVLLRMRRPNPDYGSYSTGLACMH